MHTRLSPLRRHLPARCVLLRLSSVQPLLPCAHPCRHCRCKGRMPDLGVVHALVTQHPCTPCQLFCTPNARMCTPSPRLCTPSTRICTPRPRLCTPSTCIRTPSSRLYAPSTRICTPCTRLGAPYIACTSLWLMLYFARPDWAALVIAWTGYEKSRLLR